MPSTYPILLIDDDPELGSILERVSTDLFPEAAFTQVLSCREAIAYIDGLTSYGPRLMLLDLDLCDSYGLTFLAYLKAHPIAHNIPVIRLTVSPLPADIYNAYQLGAAAFTTKPFSYADWKEYLKSLRAYWFDTVTTQPISFYNPLMRPAAWPAIRNTGIGPPPATDA